MTAQQSRDTVGITVEDGGGNSSMVVVGMGALISAYCHPSP